MSQAHNNKVFRHRKEVIKFIYDYKCQVCNKESQFLEVHHDDRNAHNNSWQNLIPLHSKCHKLVHKTNFYFNRSMLDIGDQIKAINDRPFL